MGIDEGSKSTETLEAWRSSKAMLDNKRCRVVPGQKARFTAAAFDAEKDGSSMFWRLFGRERAIGNARVM